MNSPDLNTWSGLITLPGSLAAVVRHGTILRDTTYGVTKIVTAGAIAPLSQRFLPRARIIVGHATTSTLMKTTGDLYTVTGSWVKGKKAQCLPEGIYVEKNLFTK
jgi:hypothetical protein